MTNKEIEIIAKNPELIKKFEELGEMHKTRFDNAESREDGRRGRVILSLSFFYYSFI